MNHAEPPPESEKLKFREQVWALVRQIPYGRVTSYGAIARALGAPRNARQVGWAMHDSPDEADFPAHRVIASSGELTAGWMFGHPDVMKGRLADEGVPFKAQYQVDVRKVFWDPASVAPTDEMDDLDDIAWLKEHLGEAFPGNN